MVLARPTHRSFGEEVRQNPSLPVRTARRYLNRPFIARPGTTERLSAKWGFPCCQPGTKDGKHICITARIRSCWAFFTRAGSGPKFWVFWDFKCPLHFTLLHVKQFMSVTMWPLCNHKMQYCVLCMRRRMHKETQKSTNNGTSKLCLWCSYSRFKNYILQQSHQEKTLLVLKYFNLSFSSNIPSNNEFITFVFSTCTNGLSLSQGRWSAQYKDHLVGQLTNQGAIPTE